MGDEIMIARPFDFIALGYLVFSDFVCTSFCFNPYIGSLY